MCVFGEKTDSSCHTPGVTLQLECMTFSHLVNCTFSFILHPLSGLALVLHFGNETVDIHVPVSLLCPDPNCLQVNEKSFDLKEGI